MPIQPLPDAGYDFIVCGSGSAGCAVAARLSEDGSARVLLLEAGGDDGSEAVRDGTIWFKNIGGDLDWRFQAQPTPTLNGRTPPLPMGRVLGGGSSVNGLVWARGHKNDYDRWAELSGEPAWRYDAVVGIYRRIEDWKGPAHPRLRGTGGPIHVGLPEAPVNPLAEAMLGVADAHGIPAVADLNAETMEGEGGAGLCNVITEAGRRRSMADAYVHPNLNRPNLTVVLNATVRRLHIERGRATGVTVAVGGRQVEVVSDREVILSTGAINSPRLLMQAGIGPAAVLRELGIPVVVDLPGVGQNFQDHILLGGCLWEFETPEPARNNAAEFTLFWKSDPSLPTPDLQPVLEEHAYASEVTRVRYDVPETSWCLAPGLVRPTSRGHLTLAGPGPDDPVLIHPNFLSTEQDMTALTRCVDLCRDLGNDPALARFRKREIMPGPLTGADMERFIRDAAGTYFHETGTCKMGRDLMAVVDGKLRVYGVDGLRVADGSIMPDVTTGNTMAPCVIIGERCAEEVKAAYAMA